MAEWFYQIMGEELGPVSADELRNLAQDGTIPRDANVRKGQDGKWVMADRIKGLFTNPENATSQKETPRPPPLSDTASAVEAPWKNFSKKLIDTACEACGAMSPSSAVVCVNCGLDKRQPNPAALSGFFAGCLREIWEAMRFRGGHFSFELYGVIGGWWLVSISIVLYAADMRGGFHLENPGTVIAALAGSAFGVIIGCPLVLAIETVLLGWALRICGVKFPEPDKAVNVAWDILKWKMGWTTVGMMFLFCFPPATLLGTFLVYLFLPASVYSRQLKIQYGKALLASLLVQVLSHVVAFGFLAAAILLVLSMAAVS